MRHVSVSQRRSALIAARARGLRVSPTLSERKLWSVLSAGRLLGVVFRRQVPVGGRFIADFYAPALRLIVEVDGSAHQRRRSADARRDEKLRRLGFHVVRVDAVVVLRDVEAALAAVRRAVEGLG